MTTTDPVCPMTVPFKVAHFHLSRRNELVAQLSQSRLFRAMELLARPETANGNFLRNAREGFLVPPGAHAELDEALEQLRTFARLACATEVWLWSQDVDLPASLAVRDKHKLVFSLQADLLVGRTVPELVYHLAVATFLAMDPTPRKVHFLLRLRAPFHLADRMKAYELLRLSEYAADCFALVCTGDLELTIQEGFFRSGAVGRSRPLIDLRAVARHHLDAGDLSMANLVESNLCRFTYPPLRPLVLEQFQASEVYRSCRGRTGGTTRAAFETALLELERKAHPPMTALPEYHANFFQVALTLAAFTVAEATAPVTETRKAEILEFLHLSPEQFEKIISETDWNWQEAGNADAKLQRHLANQREKAANIHSVEIMDRCVRMVLREHDGGLPEAVMDALDRIGDRCYLNAKEVKALVSALTGNILAEGGKR